MALTLTDGELQMAAMACRVKAIQDEKAAQQIENPSLRGPVEEAAKRAAALAEKFEAARKRVAK
jgi:hypothetical protein